MKQLLTPILIFSGFFISCNQPKTNLENEKQIIIKNWSDWEVKAKAGDPGYYWSDDVVIMGPGGPNNKRERRIFENVF